MLTFIYLLIAYIVIDSYFAARCWNVPKLQIYFKSSQFILGILAYSILNFLIILGNSTDHYISAISIGLLSLGLIVLHIISAKKPPVLTIKITLHLVQVSMITGVALGISGITINTILTSVISILQSQIALYALAYLLVCQPMSNIIILLLTPYEKLIKADNLQSKIGLQSAGKWIGFIERILVISFIFMGEFKAIGFLVAVKTIFRFGDLTQNKDMKLTEYMLLGTLLSYAGAILIGSLVMMML